MIRHLSKNHTVVVGSLAHTLEELKQGSGLKEHCEEVLAEVLPKSVRWTQAARALFSFRPSSVAYFWSASLRRQIEKAALRHAFDAVIVHCAFAAQYAIGIPAKFRLLDFGDLDSGKWFDYEKFRGFPLCHGYGLEARKLRSYEKKVAENFNYCTLTTAGELEEFKNLGLGLPHSVIPNGVDTSYFHPNRRSDNGAPIIVFVGRMDYFPNIDGAEYFARNIFPIIRRQIPHAELRVVGSNPNHAVRNLAMIPGIRVTGHVADVRPYLMDATVAVAPLRLARGTQNKILESMAMGVPVVTTSEAAKGVDAIPEQHVLIGDTPAAFARQVIRILKDGKLRTDLSKAGPERVEQVHSWPRSMVLLDMILDRSNRPGIADPCNRLATLRNSETVAR